MTITAADQYRRWFDYERQSHAKVLASLRAVDPALHQSPVFQKAVDLMAHIIAARLMWLFRLGAAGAPPRSLEPGSVLLADLLPQVEMMERGWSRYLARLDERELDRVVEYKSYDAGWFRSSVHDVLAQLFGHSWYHRGQIAVHLRAIGAQPASTDLIFWTRESIEPPG